MAGDNCHRFSAALSSHASERHSDDNTLRTLRAARIQPHSANRAPFFTSARQPSSKRHLLGAKMASARGRPSPSAGLQLAGPPHFRPAVGRREVSGQSWRRSCFLQHLFARSYLAEGGRSLVAPLPARAARLLARRHCGSQKDCRWAAAHSLQWARARVCRQTSALRVSHFSLQWAA